MTDAREHATAEWVLAAVAIVLTAAVVIGSMFQHPRSREPDKPGRPPAAVPTTAPAPPLTTSASLSPRSWNSDLRQSAAIPSSPRARSARAAIFPRAP